MKSYISIGGHGPFFRRGQPVNARQYHACLTKMLGAVKLPVFLALWSLSLIAVIANVRTADAAMMSHSSVTWHAVQLPSFEESLAANLAVAVKASDLSTGVWQPEKPLLASVRKQTAPLPELIKSKTIPVEIEKKVIPPRSPDSVMSDQAVVVDTLSNSPRKSAGSVGVTHEPEMVRSPVIKRLVAKTTRIKILARGHMESGEYEMAYELLRGDLGYAREDTEYLGLTAVAAIRSERMIDATILYERLIMLQPEEARWWAGLGVCQESLGLVASRSFQMAETIADAGSTLDEWLSLRISAAT